MSRARQALASTALAVSALVLTAMPATAGPGDGWTPPPPPPSGGGTTTPPPSGGTSPVSTGTTPGDTVSGPTSGQVGGCSVVSSPSFLGLSCGSGASSNLTVKDILQGDPLPDCWHEPLTEAELSAMGLENTEGPEGSHWYWERCLKGVKPDKLDVSPSNIHITIGLTSIPNGGEVKHLHGHQIDLINFSSDDKQVPAPVAVTSPSVRPRVGAWVSFFDGTDDTVTASAGGVTLRAGITGISVRPLGTGEPDEVSCAGTGYRARPGDTPQSHPDACWYRYERSSAGQPLVNNEKQPAYGVVITATWGVDVVVNGVATPFNSFTKSQVTALPVTEIQSIVVS